MRHTTAAARSIELYLYSRGFLRPAQPKLTGWTIKSLIMRQPFVELDAEPELTQKRRPRGFSDVVPYPHLAIAELLKAKVYIRTKPTSNGSGIGYEATNGYVLAARPLCRCRGCAERARAQFGAAGHAVYQ